MSYGVRGAPYMTEIQPTIHEIAAQLKSLSEKLKNTLNQEDRHILLKEFRMLLDQADQLGAGKVPR